MSTKPLLATIVILPFIMVILSLLYFAGCHPFYYIEMNRIKAYLNRVPGATVVNIGGHHDISLEEVYARVKLTGNREIVLANLSNDANNYPVSVYPGDRRIFIH